MEETTATATTAAATAAADAAEAANKAAAEAVETVKTEEPAWQPPENQEALDQLINDRLDAAKQAWQAAAPAKAEEGAKSTDQGSDKLRTENDTLRGELTALKNERATLAAGVSQDFAEFVAYQAGKGVSKDKGFDAALKDYLEAHPQYATVKQTGAWGLRQGGSPQAKDGVTAAFAGLNPTLKI